MDDQTREDTVQTEVMETQLSENDARAVVWNNFSQGIQWYWQSILSECVLIGVIIVFCIFFINLQEQLSNQLSIILYGALFALPLMIWYLVCIVKSMRSFWGTQSVWLPNAHTMIAVSWALTIAGWLITPAMGFFLQQEDVLVFTQILAIVSSFGGMIYFFCFLRQFAREFAPDLYTPYNRLLPLYSITGVLYVANVAFSTKYPALAHCFSLVVMIAGFYYLYALDKSVKYFKTTTLQEHKNAVTQDNTSGSLEGNEPLDTKQNPCSTKKESAGCGILILLVIIALGICVFIREDWNIDDLNPKKENDNITASPSNSLDMATQDKINYYSKVVSEFGKKEVDIEKEWETKMVLAQQNQISDAQLQEWIEKQYRPVWAETLDKIDLLELDFVPGYKFIKEFLTERLEGVDLIIAGLKNQSMEQVKQGSVVIVRTRIKAVLYSLTTGQNVPDNDKNITLLLAASIGDLEAVKELVKFGADVNFKDLQGKSVLDYAQQAEENEELLKYLQDASKAQKE